MHLARAQSAGRGRLGRKWESQADEGLYLSLILLPGPPMLSPVALTMLTGLALVTAARDLGVRAAKLDWPNDVVVDQAKLSGILVESRGLDASAPAYVVGVGMNVLQRRFSKALAEERAVTSLALAGSQADLARATESVLDALATRLATARNFPPTLGTEYLEETGLRDRFVQLQVGSEEHQGQLVELSLETGICLVDEGGQRSRYALEHVRSLHALPAR